MCKQHVQPQRGVSLLETCPLVFPLPGSHRAQHPTLAPRPARHDLEGTMLVPFLHPTARSAVVSPPSGWHTPTTAGSRLAWAPPPPTPSHGSTRSVHWKADPSPRSDEWLSENKAFHTERGLSVGLSAETWNC